MTIPPTSGSDRDLQGNASAYASQLNRLRRERAKIDQRIADLEGAGRQAWDRKAHYLEDDVNDCLRENQLCACRKLHPPSSSGM